jgi:hypothetical protein
VKWLGKVAQAIFLGAAWKEPPIPLIMDGENIAPFSGPLQFLSDFFHLGRRNRKFTVAEARVCAQIANLPRALPYPSQDQVIKSVKESIKIFSTDKKCAPEAIRAYRQGLTIERELLGNLESKKTHVSMVSTGALESSRKEGGRSKVLISFARKFTDLLLDFDEIKPLIDKVDQFGNRIFRSETIEGAKELLKRNPYNRVPTYGDLMYVKLEDLAIHFDLALKERYVPRELGHILNLSASTLIIEVVTYVPEPRFHGNVMFFEPGPLPRFVLTNRLRVRAGLSIEAGLKTRLTTSASAAFAHLSQLPANLMRDYLGKDPFMKVGFQESEKLWEVLKQYRKVTQEN